MGNERKIKCDCGGYFKETATLVEDIMAKGMVCPRCGHRTFTLQQTKQIVELMEMRKMMQKKRRVIRIGNSKGITLPEGLKIKVGEPSIY